MGEAVSRSRRGGAPPCGQPLLGRSEAMSGDRYDGQDPRRPCEATRRLERPHRKHRRFCSSLAAASVAMVTNVLPEARAALRQLPSNGR